MDKLERVIADIKRRNKEVLDRIVELGNNESYRIGLIDLQEVYNELLSFIDSLEEDTPPLTKVNSTPSQTEVGRGVCSQQKEPISNDLEKASEEYAYTNWQSDDYHKGASDGLEFDPISHTQESFKAGANWQKQQMVKNTIPAKGF